MAYENFCASCSELSEILDCGKYFCFMKGTDVYACDPKCGNWSEACGRSDTGRQNMYENSKDEGGCYLTTAMCDILGYPDDNYYLQMLRTFRDEILKKDIKYIPILMTYDIIGPQIAHRLCQDKNRITIAKTLFTGYITKAINAIEENKVQQAVNIYLAMTNTLARRYDINTRIMIVSQSSFNLENINMEMLGHGSSRTLKNI